MSWNVEVEQKMCLCLYHPFLGVRHSVFDALVSWVKLVLIAHASSGRLRRFA